MEQRFMLMCVVCFWPCLLALADNVDVCSSNSPDGCQDSSALLQMQAQVPTKEDDDQDGDDTASIVDWSAGDSSWKQARRTVGKENMWSQLNFCEKKVVKTSAPLSVLFGISKFWKDIQQRRSASAPLEIHVVGAAYPFEGRADWSLLARHRPSDVPSVRVVLVLGTPFQADNVPQIKDGKKHEATHPEESLLQQLGINDHHPDTGVLKDGQVICKRDGALAHADTKFKKEDVCRDHGNGLTVVCIEKYYQDVSADLPKPDWVAMFSPGFPQLSRRTWDQSLQFLLNAEVPIMVGDLLYRHSIDDLFSHKDGYSAAPGDNVPVKLTSSEDGMTLLTMDAYGAKSMGHFRNPFPILIHSHKEPFIAKNAVVQVFKGRRSDAKPLQVPSANDIQRRKEVVEAVDWKRVMGDGAHEIKRSLLTATSSAYDLAMWQLYRSRIKQHCDKQKHLRHKYAEELEKLGLGERSRETEWSLKEWIYVLDELGVGKAHIF